MALLKYILKKMLMLLPVLVGISIIAFALGIMSPGDVRPWEFIVVSDRAKLDS